MIKYFVKTYFIRTFATIIITLRAVGSGIQNRQSIMTLTFNDYQEMARQIVEGNGAIEYIKDNETLMIEYDFEKNGYVEDDGVCGYMNGTGAWVETSRSLVIESAEVFNEEGEQYDMAIDETLLENLAA